MLIEEIVSGVVSGVMYGLISSVFVILLSMIFKYFTGESFPWFLSVGVGLGIVGISGGLLALLDEPTPLSVARIMVASMILVLATNEGNRLGSRLPRKRISLLSSLRALGRGSLTTIRISDEQDIDDVPGKPRVGIGVKRRLAGTEFLLPADLPREELGNRIKRRLLADWRLGDAELELDQRGKLTYLAVSALEYGLSGSLREGSLAFPMKYDAVPAGLAPGDLVRVYSGSDLLIDSVEVKGVDEDNKTITLVLKSGDLQNCIDKEVTRVVALPRTKRGMLVEEIMTREMCTVRPDTNLREAISLMNERRVGSVVVTENDRAIGILTDRDVLQRVVKGRLETRSKVGDVMSEPVVEIPPDLSVDEALTVMRTRNVKNLPVTSRGRLVGMITSDDISRATSVVT